MTDSNAAYLTATDIIDSDHDTVIAYARNLVAPGDDLRTRAVKLYYGVRDDVRYDPYTVGWSPDEYRASTTLTTGAGWCVPKAVLYAAVCRSQDIPARLGFADVRNHLSTERMRERMKTDVFIWHGYVSVFLQNRWVKATPAFNLSLCEKFGLKPLEFDGAEDSLYHEFDEAGNRHMEYLNDRGEFADLPLQQILTDLNTFYGDGAIVQEDSANFLADVDREVSSLAASR